jgi:hypothetical protein
MTSFTSEKDYRLWCKLHERDSDDDDLYVGMTRPLTDDDEGWQRYIATITGQ